MSKVNKVIEFMELCGQDVKQRPELPSKVIMNLRIDLLLEEVKELKEAFDNNDLIEAFDALLDIRYVLDGAFGACGMQHIYEEGFNEVHRSNMSKLCLTEEEAIKTVEHYFEKDGTVAKYKTMGDKFLVYRKEDDKTLKSINYSPAVLKPILDGSPYKLKGLVQKGETNNSGRIYPSELYNKMLAEYNEAVKTNENINFGELTHPDYKIPGYELKSDGSRTFQIDVGKIKPEDIERTIKDLAIKFKTSDDVKLPLIDEDVTYREDLVNKWEKTGLLDGLVGHVKDDIAQLFVSKVDTIDEKHTIFGKSPLLDMITKMSDAEAEKEFPPFKVKKDENKD